MICTVGGDVMPDFSLIAFPFEVTPKGHPGVETGRGCV